MVLIIYVIIFNIYARFVELLMFKYYLDSYFLTNFAPRIKCIYKHYLNILNKMRIKGNLFILVLLCGFLVSANAQQSENNSAENFDVEKLYEKMNELEGQIEDLKTELEKSKTTEANSNKEKKGEGKFIIRNFVNFNIQSQDGETDLGFKLDRSYFGYEYTFNNGLKLKSIIDFGKPSKLDDYNYVAYIKNAFVGWSRKGFTINAGMIQTTQSALQEKIWAKRYIMMVFHDQYKFGSSADLGFSMEYKLSNWAKADFIMVNGEGYKKIQSNKGLLYGLGVTLTPAENFYVRLYSDINNSGICGESNIYGYSALMAYKSDKFTLSGEFNMMQNYKNVSNHNLLGCSVFGSAKVSRLIEAYARYDYITSNDHWDANNDKHAIIAGFEILPCKYVKISPNFRMNIPENGGDNKYMGYINCCFQL